MNLRSSSLLGLGSVALLSLLAACSSAPKNSGFGTPDDGSGGSKATGDDGSGSGNGGGGGTFGNTDGGTASGVCTPAPGNFDVPGNGCDDDGDGTVDNAAACDTGLSVSGSADDFAKAIGLCQTASGPSDTKWGVISAQYTRGYNQNTAPADGQHGILGKFGNTVKPQEGGSLGVLSSGWAREFDSSSGSSGAFKGIKSGMTGAGAVPPGYPKAASGCQISNEVHDVASLKLQIKVPANAQGIAFDFNFHSGEWPEFVCTTFNDGFIAYLSSSAFNNGQPENISFDSQNNPVSVNNSFFDRCTPSTQTGCAGGVKKTAACPGGATELAGTGFGTTGTYCSTSSTSGGATGWLTSQAPVAPGEVITLEFMIWDTGDASYDSSVILDHLTWLPTPTQAKTDRPK